MGVLDGRIDILLGLALDEQEQQYDDDDESCFTWRG